MSLNKTYLIPRILIGLMALAMAAATIPAYWAPNTNPGLVNLSGPALSLGETAGAFLGRQLTLIIIALVGAVSGQRQFVMIGAFGMMFMNGHDAIFMGLGGGPSSAAIGGLVFAILAAVSIYLVWRAPTQNYALWRGGSTRRAMHTHFHVRHQMTAPCSSMPDRCCHAAKWRGGSYRFWETMVVHFGDLKVLGLRNAKGLWRCWETNANQSLLKGRQAKTPGELRAIS
jgi:hypothetical protein